ncbi:hypothetical protein [Rhizobium leguminosarum]|uniref:hypothetical protein n=1 Tax=Rhizobium leguminosarum TaxID=384 RepID=UPI0012DB06E5|nr:hypothetical protein [Rhizobium leguminosarum]
MTPEQIEELFISAAETEARLPAAGERPAALRAQTFPYFHSQIDVNGWGAERFQEERADFLSLKTTRLRRAEIARWELCNDLIKLVTSVRRRRCLWAWAMAEAGTLRAPKIMEGETILKRASFSRWCRDVENVHRNWGAECKNRAVEEIASTFARNTLSDKQKSGICTLREEPETGDKTSNIEERRDFIWMTPDAFTAREDPEAQDFSWAAKRNEIRRQREEHARKRQAA